MLNTIFGPVRESKSCCMKSVVTRSKSSKELEPMKAQDTEWGDTRGSGSTHKTMSKNNMATRMASLCFLQRISAQTPCTASFLWASIFKRKKKTKTPADDIETESQTWVLNLTLIQWRMNMSGFTLHQPLTSSETRLSLQGQNVLLSLDDFYLSTNDSISSINSD